MKKYFGILLLCATVAPANAQRVLSLDSCRQMALRNNKQLGVSKLKQDVAENLRKSARTKYLPHVSAIGTYEHTSEEVSILNDGQKAALANLGTAFGQSVQQKFGPAIAQFQPQTQQLIGQMLGETVGMLNGEGQRIIDAFRTDTRNIFAGSILVTQPLFMGGSIVALNKMADINTQLAQNKMDASRHATLYQIDQAY